MWQPIETAPKDETEILVWKDGWASAYLAVFSGGEWWAPDTYPSSWTELLAVPTHWMPLPAPPAAFDTSPRAGASQVGGGYCAPDDLIEVVARAIYGHRHDATKTDHDFAMYGQGIMVGSMRNVKSSIELAKVALRAVAEKTEK